MGALRPVESAADHLTMLRRRHHCREFGCLICARCSRGQPQESQQTKSKPVRLGTDCYSVVTPRTTSRVRDNPIHQSEQGQTTVIHRQPWSFTAVSGRALKLHRDWNPRWKAILSLARRKFVHSEPSRFNIEYNSD
jgi:hypothetical protein